MSFFVRLLFGPKKISFFSFFFNKQVGGGLVVFLSLCSKKTTKPPLFRFARAHTQNKEKRREREKKKERDMASMGDDQEENIEMWKIKKVSGPRAQEEALFFFGLALCLFSVGESPDDDDDVAFLFCFLLLALSLSLCVCVSLLLVNERNEENARFRSSLSVSRFLFVSIR